MSTPSVWLPPLLATLLNYHAVTVRCGAAHVDTDALSDPYGYAALLAAMINRRLPGAVPLDEDVTTPCGWRVAVERVTLPISLLGPLALDAVLALPTEQDGDLRLDALLAQFHGSLHHDSPLRALIAP